MGDSKRQLKGICFLCSAIRRIGFWSGYFRYSISLPLGLIKGVLCGSATDRAASAPATGTGSGTISECDSGGCRPLSLNAKARARSGCGALYRVLGKGNWCIQNQRSFPDPVPIIDLCATRMPLPSAHRREDRSSNRLHRIWMGQPTRFRHHTHQRGAIGINVEFRQRHHLKFTVLR